MKDIILSIKIVFLFLRTREKEFISRLTNMGLFKEPDLLKTKLKKISSFIIAFFPMIFIVIYDKSGVIERFVKSSDINLSFVTHIITFVMVIITVLIILSVVLTVYVFNFISNQKSINDINKSDK